MTAALYIAWYGCVWVLRGGLFGKIYRRLRGVPDDERPEISAVTRIVCSGLAAGPLWFFVGWWAIALWASIFASMTIGYFNKAMGLQKPGDPFWMALWGVTVVAIAIFPMAVVNQDFFLLALAPVGALAALAYAVNKPFGRRFGTDWTERSEFCSGLCFGAAMLGAVL
jgi:hypothetical protein